MGATVLGLVLGYLASDVGRLMGDNPELQRRLGSMAGGSILTVKGFLAYSFAAVAVVTALYAGAQLIAAREEEVAGRVETLITSGSSRMRWLGVRLAVGGAAVTVVTALGGLAAWVGVGLSGSQVGLGDALAGALNTLPLAVLFGGLTTLSYGVAPRATAATAYGAVAASYALLLVTALTAGLAWLADLSPFHHLAAVPAQPFRLLPAVIMCAAGLAAAAVGAAAFDRRDLVGA